MKASVFGLFSALVLPFGAVAAAPATATANGTATAVAPATVAAPAVPKISKSAPLVEWTGTWAGTVNQVGRASAYAISIALSAKSGQTTYPDQHCAGKLVRVAASGNYAFFIETITDGKFDPATKAGCLDGSLTLEKDGDALVMTWMTAHDSKPIVAYGTLTARKKS